MVSAEDLLDYFVNPTKEGYTPGKTLAFALVLIAAVYAIFWVLKKLKIKIDRKLVIAIFPYIILG